MTIKWLAAVRRLVTGLAPQERRQTTRTVRYLPARTVRETDPDYRYFDRHRRDLERRGQLVCALPGLHEGGVELHHQIPYALKDGLDPAKLAAVYGVPTRLTSFPVWFHTVQVVPYCAGHHRAVHALGVPEWLALAVWRDDLPAPIRVERTT